MEHVLFHLADHFRNDAIEHIEIAKLDHQFTFVFRAHFDFNRYSEGVG